MNVDDAVKSAANALRAQGFLLPTKPDERCQAVATLAASLILDNVIREVADRVIR